VPALLPASVDEGSNEARFINEQTGAPAFGYPAKDQPKLAAECRRL
jgi:hypothetical protein